MLPTGTLFYGVSSNPDSLMYAGDRCICLALHASIMDDSKVSFIYLQSLFMQYNHEQQQQPAPDEDYGCFDPEFQLLVRQYLICPTFENAQEIHDYYDSDYPVFEFTSLEEIHDKEFKTFLFSPESFNTIKKEQHEIVPDNSNYIDEYICRELGYERIESPHRMYSLQEFQSAFFPHTLFGALPFNSNPL